MDLKSKSGQYSKYSDWLRDSTTLFRFLAVTYCFTSPPPCVRMHGDVPPLLHMHFWNRTRTSLAYSMQVACWAEHPAICSVFGRMQIGISAWRTDNLTNVSWLRFVITDNCWNIIWKDVTTILPRNFNECRGGMISLVLQTSRPNISACCY